MDFRERRRAKRLSSATLLNFDTVVHLGLGYGAELPMLQELYPQANYIAAEPNPYWKEFHEGADVYPGEIYPVAIGGKTGKQVMQLRSANDQRASLNLLPYKSDEHLVEVDVITLSELQKRSEMDWGNCLLWADCEGSEFEVFRESVDVLQDMVRAIVVESSMMPIREGHKHFLTVDAVLSEAGFVPSGCLDLGMNGTHMDLIYIRKKDYPAIKEVAQLTSELNRAKLRIRTLRQEGRYAGNKKRKADHQLKRVTLEWKKAKRKIKASQ